MSYEGEEKTKEMKKPPQQIPTRIEKANKMYRERANKHHKAITFKPGDLVWLYLRKERFPSRRRNKIMPRGVQNCMVKCFGRNLLLKHDLTFISLQGGFVHTLRSAPMS